MSCRRGFESQSRMKFEYGNLLLNAFWSPTGWTPEVLRQELSRMPRPKAVFKQMPKERFSLPCGVKTL